MTAAEFAVKYRPQADTVSAGTGIAALVLLAQWGLETGWGNQINNQNNLGNIRDAPGSFAQLPSLAAFCDLAIATWHNGYYGGVLGVVGDRAQIIAIGQSPWDAGHYDNGGGPGSALLAYYKEIADMDATDPNFQALIWRVAVTTGTEKTSAAPDAVQPGLVGIVTLGDLSAKLDALTAAVATKAQIGVLAAEVGNIAATGGLSPADSQKLTDIATALKNLTLKAQ